MPALVIPDKYKSGLSVLRGLQELQVGTLIDALGRLPSTVARVADIITHAKGSLPDLDEPAFEELIRTLCSMYQVRAFSEVSVDQFVRDIVEAMRSSGDVKLRLDGDEEQFSSKLEQLLRIEALSFNAKAAVLQREHEHIFHEAKILTDLRPIFHEPDQEPTDVILEYTLKVVYHDGHRHEEIYMSLDEGDLGKLKASIARAETKARSLRSFLKAKAISERSDYETS